jgi:hypothetical protein
MYLKIKYEYILYNAQPPHIPTLVSIHTPKYYTQQVLLNGEIKHLKFLLEHCTPKTYCHASL